MKLLQRKSHLYYHPSSLKKVEKNIRTYITNSIFVLSYLYARTESSICMYVGIRILAQKGGTNERTKEKTIERTTKNASGECENSSP